MDNENLLQAISEMIDIKLDSIHDSLDKMNNHLEIIELKQTRTDKKLDNLRLDIAVAERDIRRDVHELKDEMETVIEILKLNELLPK